MADGFAMMVGTYSDRFVVTAFSGESGTKYYQFNWVSEDGVVTISAKKEVELQQVVREKGTNPTIEMEFAAVESALMRSALLGDRWSSLSEHRQKEGRVLSRANRDRLARLQTLLGQVGGDIEKLLIESDPDDGKSKEQEKEAEAVALAVATSIETAVRIRGDLSVDQT